MEDVYHGLSIQLITYLGAISENGRKDLPNPILPGGIFYLRLDDPLVKSEMDMSEEEIEKSIIKQLKLQGILLGDISLIRDMDTDIDGDSIIVPARINKGDTLGRGSHANHERFIVLQKYVKKLLTEISQDMMDGNVSIKPYKKEKEISCRYCKYLSICQFDPKFGEDTFKIIEKKDSDTIYGMMQKRLEE
jgi:ATP-dependent helicase/nuclease subunit B